MPDVEEPRIGAFRIERLLGRGGMGEVYLAWDERLQRRVALKRVRGDALPDSQIRERFRREARSAARLSHPAVVQVHDLLEDGSGDCLVLEYVEGQTLAALLAAGPPETGLALRLAREIAAGLAHAHAQGLLHRDLKPQNVIVTPDGHAKILDFGLAKPISLDDEETLTAHGTVLGTFHSMSPEQALGRDLDERSDLFSFGILLYELLSGRAPFKGATATETLDRLLHHEPPPLSNLPPEISDLVTRLLAKDRELRPRKAEEVIRVLEGTSGSRPVRRGALVVIGAAVAIGALLLSGLRTAPLRVVVPSPAVDGDLGLVASGILSSALGTLSSLKGIAPLEPSHLGVTGSSPVELARSSAADEVLLASVATEGEMARVSLKRVQGKDGRVLWAETFQVPAGPRDLALLADAVQVHLRRAFPDHPPRPGTPGLEARAEDYRAFLEVKQRVDSGKTSWEP
ncbi:MAG TPA: serine/threonine-protein kinase, partial [Thermoanaerobaculia bacterium]|nr:serine/threonine-protein kinase [Thermoanaerobaculia bacterium]